MTELDQSIDPEENNHSQNDLAAESSLIEASSTLPGALAELSGGIGAMYMREINIPELLSAEDEIKLAQDLETGKAALSEIAVNGGTLSNKKIEELRRLSEEGERARRRLIESNLRLVVSVAYRYLNRGVSFLDLVQEGNIGLQVGTERYEWRLGNRFSTYVYWWIRRGIAKAVADQSRTIRLPVHVIGLLTQAARAERELEFTLGREPTEKEIAGFLEIAPEKIREVRRAAMPPLSLEAPVGEDGEATRGDFVGDDDAASAGETGSEQDDLKKRLDSTLNELQPREKQVLRLRFGLDRGHQRTLKEVGRELGVSRERIRQIETEALAKLRRMPKLRRELLEYFS